MALQGPGPGAVTSATLKLPDKPASVARAVGRGVGINVFSGPDSVPDPNRVSPRGPRVRALALRLHYSGELGNGPLGIGWALARIAITRSLPDGVPRYDDSDELDLPGRGRRRQLIRDPGIAGPLLGRGQRARDPRRPARVATSRSATIGHHYFLGVDAEGTEGVTGRTRGWHVESVQNVVGQKNPLPLSQRREPDLSRRRSRWGPSNVYLGDVELRERPDVTTSFRAARVRTALRASSVTVTAFGETAELLS